MRQTHDRHAARAAVAAVAARMLADDAARDFADARSRAMRELGIDDRRTGPDNMEIQRALIDYLGLFRAAEQAALIDRLRRVALKAMRLFEDFEPRLCGAVLYGTATASSPIIIHLAHDESEAVTRFLLDRGIDYQLGHASRRFPGSKAVRDVPLYATRLGGELIEFLVFPRGGPLRRPLSDLDNRPQRGATIPQLEALIDAGEPFAPGYGLP
ncbi:MAG: hypothetical protein ACU85V_03530 [Gammaproteobacteria bacterium]